MLVLYFVLNFRVHFIFSVVRRGKIPLRRGKFDVLRSTRKDSLIVTDTFAGNTKVTLR